MEVDIEDFKNRVFSHIIISKQQDKLYFIDTDDSVYFTMRHDQQCCESVELEDICGDLEDLTLSPIMDAEEVCEEGNNRDASYTWTFYKIRSGVGSVTIRWYGCSNGYYSERVGIYKYPLKHSNPCGEVHRRIPYYKENIPKSLSTTSTVLGGEENAN